MSVMKRVTAGLAVLGVALVAVPQANAQAVISSGNVSLGVNAGGALNFAGVGVKSNVTGHDGTIAGCPCEGWGVGTATGGVVTFVAGQNESTTPLVGAATFTSTATTATSIVTNLGLQVTQFYHPSTNSDLYQVDVTITNMTGLTVGDATNGIRYRREMDWDIPPTVFDEYTTLQGVGASHLLHSSDDGFVSSDMSIPLGTEESHFPSSDCPTNTLDQNFYHNGPCDHGAAFDFGFPALDAGASQTFTIFYGVASDEATALADLGSVSADNVYSLGQSNCAGVPLSGGDAPCVTGEETFIFGFKGVGGTTLGTPEPASIALMGTGLVGLAGFARRRRAAKQA